MSKKQNFDIDETLTYGLSNNSFQLDVKEFEEYTGNEILLKYAAVKDDNRFDIKNVFFNQSMDTHPPLYYLLVNFVCSLFPNTFSMWYGLVINLIFLIIIFFEMRYLFSLITEDKIYATILSYIPLISYGFINMYTFTRMYVMLSATSMAFVILIIKKIKEECSVENIKEKSDNKFLLNFLFICVLGILTQYHFLFVAAFYSLFFAFYLIKTKNYKLLVKTFIVGVLSLVISYMIFPQMINHMFSGKGLHSINSDTNQFTTIELFITFVSSIYSAFMSYGGILYIIILLLLSVSLYVKRQKILKDSSKISDTKSNKFNLTPSNIYLLYFASFVFYFVMIIATIKYDFGRYFYNIYPIIVILIYAPIYMILKKINTKFTFIVIILAFVMSLTTKIDRAPTALHLQDELFKNYLYENRDVKTILLYRSVDEKGNTNSQATSKWQLSDTMYLFKDLKNLTYVDIGTLYSNIDGGVKNKIRDIENKTIEGYNDIFLVIFTKENDSIYINEIMAKNDVNMADRVYFNNYFHIYRLH